MQIPLVCVAVGDGDDGTDEGADVGVEVGVDAGADVAGAVVECVAVGEDCMALDDAAGVVDCAA